MHIIVGLGNPTKEYQNTRHNIGFDVIDALAAKYNISVDGRQSRAFIGKGVIEGQKVILVKPQTYMNLSGNCVKEFVDFFKIENEKVLIIYDDMDIEPGTLLLMKITWKSLLIF